MGLKISKKVLDKTLSWAYNKDITESPDKQRLSLIKIVDRKGSFVDKAQKVRYRLTVPNDDEIVLKFLEAQHNQSLSLREIIKNYVRENGFRDVFSTSVSEVSTDIKKTSYTPNEDVISHQNISSFENKMEDARIVPNEDMVPDIKKDDFDVPARQPKEFSNKDVSDKASRLKDMLGY